MVKESISNVIMISIHPHYAEAIFSGEKKIEFRKLNIPKTANHVILYATAPEQKIVGYFSIKEIIEDKPKALWRKYKHWSGTTEDFYYKYFAKQKSALGILIDKIYFLKNPIIFDKAGLGKKPPQSFLYVNSRFWKNIRRRKKK